MHISLAGKKAPGKYDTYFHYDAKTGFHEAYTASAAIYTRVNSDIRQSQPLFGNDAGDKLAKMHASLAAAREVKVHELWFSLNVGIEAAANGDKLRAVVGVEATKEQLTYLGESLVKYQVLAPDFVLDTTTRAMSSVSEQSAYLRVTEADLAIPGMLRTISRITGEDFTHAEATSKPFGFARELEA